MKHTNMLLPLPLLALLAGCVPATTSISWNPPPTAPDNGQLIMLAGDFTGPTKKGPSGWVTLLLDTQAPTLVSAQLPPSYVSSASSTFTITLVGADDVYGVEQLTLTIISPSATVQGVADLYQL
jgi:hypothetical protein